MSIQAVALLEIDLNDGTGPYAPGMATRETTQAGLVLGPAHDQDVDVPLRPNAKPPRLFKVEVDGMGFTYLRRHVRSDGRWVYIYEPDAK